ncbi:aldo/keto reductase [Deinococcus koreensis]|uniref:Aldo/keto reductase n=1 Tax=Deinococcus koreensis TaxID=2054903 RepID=A0A2K3USI2_9DEIO|nr:aldo/keto reductase [Deinococcus koreensis]PNY79488.1 aldo/keto reductase [Deinococcus koreensis]
MQYRTLGRSGLIVSAFALGTMQFGQAMNMGSLDQAATTDMVKFALDQGINFIDTADVYSRGESESQLGVALRGLREEVVLASKFRLPMSDTNVNRSGATRVNILRGVESSLRRLQTDYLDLYQVHGWDSHTPLEETLSTLNDLVRRGLVRHIGLSNYLAWQAATALGIQERRGWEPFVTAQLYYSLVGRELEHEWMDLAAYSGLGVLVWSPLAGGYLSAKYDRPEQAPAGTRFGEAGQFVPFSWEKGRPVLEALRAVAARHSVTPAQVALAWTVSQPGVSSVIIAARSTERLGENIRSLDIVLSDEDRRELDRASHPGTPYPKWMVLQLDQAEDPRTRTLEPGRFEDGGPWEDLRQGPKG